MTPEAWHWDWAAATCLKVAIAAALFTAPALEGAQTLSGGGWKSTRQAPADPSMTVTKHAIANRLIP